MRQTVNALNRLYRLRKEHDTEYPGDGTALGEQRCACSQNPTCTPQYPPGTMPTGPSNAHDVWLKAPT
eukprot:m.831732 g.831732  ORF g.831732 m.831732 type:complete len:68 (-) comp23430_c0_seq54:1915-2118(-)